KGMIHRDIKPSNIMIGPDGKVKVLDFGIAKIMGPNSHMTTNTGRVGTAAYMSPEQILNKGIDARTDIFSLGIMLFYTATGIHPFAGVISDFELSDSLVRKPLPIPQSINPGVTERIANIIRKATQKHALDRFQNCRAMADAFTSYMAPSSNTPSEAPSASRQNPSYQEEIDDVDDRANANNGFRIWAISLIMLAAIASVWVYYSRGKPGPDPPPKMAKYSKKQIETWPEKSRDNLRVGLKLTDFSEGVIAVEQAWASEEKGGLQVHVRGDSIFAIDYGVPERNRVEKLHERKDSRPKALLQVGCDDPACACMPGDIFKSREAFFIACMESAFNNGCAVSLSDFDRHVGANYKSCMYCWDCGKLLTEYPLDDFYYKAYTNNGYSENACDCEPCSSKMESCLVVYFPRPGGQRRLCKSMKRE
ncbi:MAG: serine/threonine protein kinase, partial [Flavobacteriales bacterium]